MNTLASVSQAAFSFTGGKLRSTWRDPEKCKSPKCKDYNLKECTTRVKMKHQRISRGLCRCFTVPPVLQLHKLPPVRTVPPPSAAGVLPWWPTCSRWQRRDDPETESPPTGWTSPWEESPPTHNITAYIQWWPQQHQTANKIFLVKIPDNRNNTARLDHFCFYLWFSAHVCLSEPVRVHCLQISHYLTLESTQRNPLLP